MQMVLKNAKWYFCVTKKTKKHNKHLAGQLEPYGKPTFGLFYHCCIVQLASTSLLCIKVGKKKVVLAA